MRQYVPDPVTSDAFSTQGVKVERLPFVSGNFLSMIRKNDIVTGFSKNSEYEDTYRIDFQDKLPPGVTLTEVTAWASVPAFVVAVAFDDTRADISVWGGAGGNRYTITVAFAAGVMHENRSQFVVKPDGEFTIFGMQVPDFPAFEEMFHNSVYLLLDPEMFTPAEAQFDVVMNELLPSYNFSPWGS